MDEYARGTVRHRVAAMILLGSWMIMTENIAVLIDDLKSHGLPSAVVLTGQMVQALKAVGCLVLGAACTTFKAKGVLVHGVKK